jgi:hypothetical protein
MQHAISVLAQLFAFAITFAVSSIWWYQINIFTDSYSGKAMSADFAKLWPFVGLAAAYVALRIVRAITPPHSAFPWFSLGFVVTALTVYTFNATSVYTTGDALGIGVVFGLIVGYIAIVTGKAYYPQTAFLNTNRVRPIIMDNPAPQSPPQINSPQLLSCPACTNPCSSAAKSCPKCGHPFA